LKSMQTGTKTKKARSASELTEGALAIIKPNPELVEACRSDLKNVFDLIAACQRASARRLNSSKSQRERQTAAKQLERAAKVIDRFDLGLLPSTHRPLAENVEMDFRIRQNVTGMLRRRAEELRTLNIERVTITGIDESMLPKRKAVMLADQCRQRHMPMLRLNTKRFRALAALFAEAVIGKREDYDLHSVVKAYVKRGWNNRQDTKWLVAALMSASSTTNNSDFGWLHVGLSAALTSTPPANEKSESVDPISTLSSHSG
jgi:hypothetical protein